ncbi:MAG: caspase family protein [bacterium]
MISGKSAFKPVKAGKVQAAKKVKEVPDLIIKEEVFEDPNSTNIIDGNENSSIRFKIENLGTGMAKYVTVHVSLKNKMIQGLEYRAMTIVGQISPNETKDVVVPIQGKIDLEQGLAEFKIEVREDQGFDAFPLEMKIETHPFEPPHVIVADAVFSTENGGKLKLNSPLQMKFIVQNIGNGDAKNVNVSCALPNDCLLTGESDQFTVGGLAKGESRELEFLFIATRRYTQKTIPIRISVTESFNKYGQDTTASVSLDQELLAQSKVVIGAMPATSMVQKVSLSSAVDKNIPYNSTVNNKKFALIIGNEDYSKFQPGLQSEMNVLFARNDAVVFKDYVTRTLGFPEENVYLLQDATTGEMNQKIELISKLAIKTGADAELLFYYAGHGLPDEATHTPYLIPVDVSGTNLNSAIKLSDIYKKFSETGCKRITVFLDACFSGGGRESGLLAARSIRIKPSEENIAGNMIVFSATKGDQSAMPYKSEKHGLFTYFLLKKLQETSGNLNYMQLADYLSKTVSIESLKINQKEQDPEVNVSAEAKDLWVGWKFNN